MSSNRLPPQYGQIEQISYKQGYAFVDYTDKHDAEVSMSHALKMFMLP